MIEIVFPSAYWGKATIAASQAKELMDDISLYRTAQDLHRKKRYAEARLQFERVLEADAPGAAKAAYSLGIYWHSGLLTGLSRADRNVLAEEYYSLAEDMGYAMATYRKGALRHNSGRLEEALESYRQIAPSNPSAAYWVYRIITDGRCLAGEAGEAGEAETHLSMAAEQGHVLAQRIIAMRYIRGKFGFRRIPRGVMLFLQMTWNLSVIFKEEKLKYS